MAKEKMILQLRWYSWMITSIYEFIIGIFMALIGIGGLVMIVGYYLGYISQITKIGHWYEHIIILLFSGFLSWAAVRAFFTSGKDLMLSALTYEGRVDKLERIFRPKFRVWVISSGDKQWNIPIYDLPENFSDLVREGSQVRINYRQGTGWVTALSIIKD